MFLFNHIFLLYYGNSLSSFWEKWIPIEREKKLEKHKFFTALQVFFNIMLMMSMMENTCQGPKN